MKTTLKANSYTLTQADTYKLSALFVAGNIILPQLCHLVPGGGLVWLPIYFFTLIAAYRYGMAAGMLTALCSPVANNLLFGMPPTPMLPVILTKSTLLAVAASLVGRKAAKPTVASVLLVVAIYQGLGSLAEWGITGTASAAMQDLRVGWPGMAAQVFGGWVLLRRLANN